MDGLKQTQQLNNIITAIPFGPIQVAGGEIVPRAGNCGAGGQTVRAVCVGHSPCVHRVRRPLSSQTGKWTGWPAHQTDDDFSPVQGITATSICQWVMSYLSFNGRVGRVLFVSYSWFMSKHYHIYVNLLSSKVINMWVACEFITYRTCAPAVATICW